MNRNLLIAFATNNNNNVLNPSGLTLPPPHPHPHTRCDVHRRLSKSAYMYCSRVLTIKLPSVRLMLLSSSVVFSVTTNSPTSRLVKKSANSKRRSARNSLCTAPITLILHVVKCLYSPHHRLSEVFFEVFSCFTRNLLPPPQPIPHLKRASTKITNTYVSGVNVEFTNHLLY